MKILRTKLRCQNGNSDKEYIVSLVQKDDCFSVLTSYGKTGNPTKDGVSKHANSISNAIIGFNRIVNEKKKKGYRIIHEYQDDSFEALVRKERMNNLRPFVLPVCSEPSILGW